LFLFHQVMGAGQTLMLNRRDFLKWSLAGGAVLAGARSLAQSQPAERRLKLYNTHTGEQLAATYWANGQYQDGELAAIDRLLRDHRSGDVVAIDRRLYEILYILQQRTSARGTYEVISGYRSPATNNLLRRHSDGVARNSLHTHGQAIDIRLPGVALTDLRQAALDLRAGGVGNYSKSDFIHLDTGRVRAW
jgi:uncharacterized protein YcbK (DUF882 family)